MRIRMPGKRPFSHTGYMETHCLKELALNDFEIT